MKCINCGAELAPEDKFCGECGAPRPERSPERSRRVPSRFAEAERRFAALRARYQAGELDDAAYRAELQNLIVQDQAGGYWTLGDAGEWYWYDGQQWVRRDPPLAGVEVERPEVWPAPPPAVALPVPAAPPTKRGFPWKWIAVGCVGLLVVAAVFAVPRLLPLVSTPVQPTPVARAAPTATHPPTPTSVPPSPTAVPATPTPKPTATRPPTPAPVPSPTPLLSPDAIPGRTIEHPETGLAFRSHAARPFGEDLEVFGEVENVSDGVIETGWYQLWFTPYDATGQVIRTKYDLATDLFHPVLVPGQKSPFLGYVIADVSEDLMEQIDHYEVEIRRTGLGASGALELSVQGLEWIPGGELTGVLLNDTEFTTSELGPFVLLALCDANGRVIDVTYAENDWWFLAPGETCPFFLSGSVPSEVATVEAWAVGYPAEGVIFYDDFSDPASGWETYALETGEVRYEGGTLAVVAKGPGGVAGVALPGVEAQDFYLSFHAAPMSDPGDWEYGVDIRVVPEGNWYEFGLTADGRYVVAEWVDGERVLLVDYTPSEAIETSGTNYISIYAEGPTLEFRANGEELAEVTDVQVREGAIELWVYVSPEQEVKVAFDDVVVEELPW